MKLSFRIMALVVVAATAILSMLGGLSVWNLKRLLVKQQRESAHAAGVRLAASIPELVWTMEEKKVLRVLNAELADPQVLQIALEDRNGLLNGVWRRSEKGELLSGGGKPADPGIQHTQELTSIILGRPLVVGKVVITMDGSLLRKTLSRELQSVLKQIVLVDLVLILILSIGLERTLLRRLRGLERGMRRIAQNPDVAPQLSVNGDDELSYLAQKANDMLNALDASKEKERQKSHALESMMREKRIELRQALKVQQGTLPQFHHREGVLGVTGFYRPHAELCGDFFDLYSRDKALTLFLSDVSGHGAGAAMVTMALKLLMNRLVDENGHGVPDPSQLLQELDVRMGEIIHPDLHYATAICAVYDFESRRLSIANAAHPSAILFNRNGDILGVMKQNFPPLNIGLEPQLKVVRKIEPFTLEPGHRVLFYTDGLVENHDLNGHSWETSDLFAVIKTNASLEAARLLQKLYDASLAFTKGNGHKDDVAMMIVEYLE